jgi:hypothetical protein
MCRRLIALKIVAAVLAVGSYAAPATAQLVRLSDLKDLNFANLVPGRDAVVVEDVCIFSNAVGGAYRISVSGSAQGNSFILQGPGTALPIVLMWSARAGDRTGMAVHPGETRTGLHSAASDEACGSGASASLIVQIRAADLGHAMGGALYSGTITLMVGPE